MRNVAISGIVCVLTLLSFGNSAVRADEQRPEDLYKTYCWQCHGKQGNGMGINVRDMSVQPRDHTDAKEMSARSDDELFKAIKEGGQAVSKSVLMPPWGGVLSDEEIKGLVGYLRRLCQCQHGAG